MLLIELLFKGEAATRSKRMIPLTWPIPENFGKLGIGGNFVANQVDEDENGRNEHRNTEKPTISPQYAWKSNRLLGNFRHCTDRGCIVKAYTRFPIQTLRSSNIKKTIMDRIMHPFKFM